MVTSRLDRFFTRVTGALGSHWAVIIAVAVLVIWAISGPWFKFSDTWQLIINTGTTIVTFLMVFVIQNTQNRGDRALHAKLDGIVKALDGVDNRLAGSERLSGDEIEKVIEGS